MLNAAAALAGTQMAACVKKVLRMGEKIHLNFRGNGNVFESVKYPSVNCFWAVRDAVVNVQFRNPIDLRFSKKNRDAFSGVFIVWLTRGKIADDVEERFCWL